MTNLKELSTEEKVEKLLAYLRGEEITTELAFNVFLQLIPPVNYRNDFFEHEAVMYSNVIEFVKIAGKIKKEIIEFAGHLLGMYEACFKHCVPITTDKKEVNVPDHFLRVFALLDFQKIDKLYEKYEAYPNNYKYTNSYKVMYGFLQKFDFYINIMSEGGFGDDKSSTTEY